MKKNMKRNVPALAVLMAGCMLFAAGCGAKQESTAAAETTKAEAKTETTAAAAEAAETTQAAAETAPAAPEAEMQLEDSPEWVGRMKEAENAEQLFVVAGIGDTTAYISMHEKDADGKWKQVMTSPGFIGKNGLGKDKEGDAKTPVGTYSFNCAFGIADDPGCALPYHKVTEDDYWSGDQRDGCKYNEMVSIKDFPDLNVPESEHLIDYFHQYQYCLNISYNDAGTPGLGSAIFLHCFGPVKPYTGGCVAVPNDKMQIVMKNVRPDCVVVIDSLENISPELWEEFGFTSSLEEENPQAYEKAMEEYASVLETLPEDHFFAFADMSSEHDALLVAGPEDTFTGPEDVPQAIRAKVYGFDKDGNIKEYGTVESGGTANPLAAKDGELYMAGHHFTHSARIDEAASELAVNEEASSDDYLDAVTILFRPASEAK